MVLNVSAAAVGVSATAEEAIGAQLATTAFASAAALLGVIPMGADLDSAQFAAALNAAGAACLGANSEHAINRELFAQAQQLAAGTYTAADVASNAALAL